MWEVGLDLLEYPEYYNAQRDGNLVHMDDEEFWNGLMEESCNCCDQYLVVGSGVGGNMGLPKGVVTTAADRLPDDDESSRAAYLLEGADSSSGSTTMFCSQLKPCLPWKGKQVEGS